MNRDDILQIAKAELEKHDFSTFVDRAPGAPTGGVTVPGCPHCKLKLQTVPQFVRHLSDDVLPGILDLAIGGGREPGMEPKT